MHYSVRDLPGYPSIPTLKDNNLVSSKPLPPRPVSGIQRWGRKFPNGWRAGVLTGATISTIVLLINISVAVWGQKKFNTSDGFGMIYQGSCTKSKSLTLWIHLAINALSTLLLGASNYAMQCLSSPTREDVNRAHAKHIWLDIGISGTRNIWRLGRKRLVLWWCLGCSSVLLHLM